MLIVELGIYKMIEGIIVCVFYCLVLIVEQIYLIESDFTFIFEEFYFSVKLLLKSSHSAQHHLLSPLISFNCLYKFEFVIRKVTCFYYKIIKTDSLE